MITETFANTPGARDAEMERKKRLANDEFVQSVLIHDRNLKFGSLEFRKEIIRRISGKLNNDCNRLYALAELYKRETGHGELNAMLQRYKKSRVDLHRLADAFPDEVKLLAATARGRIEALTTDSMIAIASEFLRPETEQANEVTEECAPMQFSNQPVPDRLLLTAIIEELRPIGIVLPNDPDMTTKRFLDLLLHTLRSRRATLANLAAERRQKAAKQQADARKREQADAERDESTYEYPERKRVLHEGDNAQNVRIG